MEDKLELDAGQFKELQKELLNHFKEMSDKEKEITLKSYESFMYYIRKAINEIAKRLGYAVALPAKMATEAGESFWQGMKDCWNDNCV